jgi:hypothetical protein
MMEPCDGRDRSLIMLPTSWNSRPTIVGPRYLPAETHGGPTFAATPNWPHWWAIASTWCASMAHHSLLPPC